MGLDLSKIVTPSCMSPTMEAFDCSKACWCSSVHEKVSDGLSRALNGSIVGVMLKAYDTWFTRPNHDLASVRFFGVGKSWMALVYFLQGFTVVGVISNPANSTLSRAKRNFSGLSVTLFEPQTSSHSTAWR